VLPNGAYSYALIASGVVSLGCILLLASNLRTTAKAVRNLYHLTFIYVLSQFLIMVGIYAQNGYFIVASIVQFLTVFPLMMFTYIALRIIILPIFAMYATQQLKADRLLKITMFTIGLLGSLINIVFFFTVADSNPEAFNSAACAFFFNLSLALFMICIVVEVTVHRFISILSNSRDTTLSASIKKKILIIRSAIRRQLGPIVILSMAYPLAHLTIGSFPFHYVFYFVQLCGSFPVALTLIAYAFTTKQFKNILGGGISMSVKVGGDTDLVPSVVKSSAS